MRTECIGMMSGRLEPDAEDGVARAEQRVTSAAGTVQNGHALYRTCPAIEARPRAAYNRARSLVRNDTGHVKDRTADIVRTDMTCEMPPPHEWVMNGRWLQDRSARRRCCRRRQRLGVSRRSQANGESGCQKKFMHRPHVSLRMKIASADYRGFHQ
jgi:hypothetical protein